MVDAALARPKFAAKISESDGCWLWKGNFDPDGYGAAHLTINGKTVRSAHRGMYLLVHGSIPEGFVIHHTCGVRACVNPDHLEACSVRDNVLRSDNFVAVNAAKTHCVNGHRLDEKNTYIWHGQRECRKCRNAAHARWLKRRIA